MALQVITLFSASLLLLNTVCGSTTENLYATTSKVGKYVYSYNNNDRKSYYITPAYRYHSGSYYLEITWSVFDVKGYMPYCNEDRVEVYLTRSKKSIGRFCSYNAGLPFKMYSHDGVATIELVSDSKTTGRGFTFYYELKSKTSERIRGSPTSTYCYNTYNYASSGVLFSSGWPDGYSSSYSDCKYSITRSNSYTNTKVVFMDVDLVDSDELTLYGSSSSYGYRSALGYVTSTKYSIKSYKTTYKYLKLEFQRRDGSSSSRGFVAGYISYGRPSSKKNRDTSNINYFSYTYIIPVVVVVICAILLSYFKRRRRLLATRGRNNVTIAVGTRHEPAVTATEAPLSYPQNTASYPTAYPTSYPESSLSTNPPPSYVWTVGNNDIPTSADTKPPPYPTFQSQYPQVPYSTMTASPYPSDVPPPNAPPNIPPISSPNMPPNGPPDLPPDAPPPSYDTAVYK